MNLSKNKNLTLTLIHPLVTRHFIANPIIVKEKKLCLTETMKKHNKKSYLFETKVWILRRILKYSSPLLKHLENKLLKSKSKIKQKKPIVFILGAPRTGSTLLYQLISTHLNVSYINNLVYLGREIPFITFLFSNILFGNKFNSSFASTYGNTLNEGLKAPSEAGNLWRKWIPKEKVYIEPEDIEEKKLESFSSFLKAITHITNLPIIVKNLYFSQRLRYLQKSDLNIKFIYIKREPIYTAQSIYKARQKNNTNINDWWSVEPANYSEIKNLNPFKQIAAQIYYLEKQIENDLKLFNANNVMTIHYEDISDPYYILLKISDFIGTEFPNKKIENIFVKNQKQISTKEFEQLKQEIDKLYKSK